MAARLSGSFFLSGRTDPTLNIWTGPEENQTIMSAFIGGQHVSSKPVLVPHGPVCISGHLCSYPDLIAGMCRQVPTSTMYVCPVIDELAAFGAVCFDETPRKIYLSIANKDELEAEYQEFQPDLDGDGLGRMAGLVAKGLPVWNQMRKPLGVTAFYDRMLVKEVDPGIPCVYIVRLASMDTYFPSEPISARLYAASTVPVAMKVTDEFRAATKCEGETVWVLSATEHVTGLPQFMQFYQLMSGMDWVVSVEPKSVDPIQNMPVFRHDKGYRVPLEMYQSMRGDNA